MVGGHGMRPENKAKTAGELNRLWDHGEISVMRGTSGRIQLFDRRLTAHLMIQPTVVQDALTDVVLMDSGFWPRFLLAWPEPAKPRKMRPFRPETIPEIRQFWQRCTELLPETERDECENLTTLKLTDKAQNLLGSFFEGMENEAKLKTGRYFDTCKPFALRASEQACRIAGVMAVYNGTETIDTDLMKNGMVLSLYSVESWRSAFNQRDSLIAAELAYRYLKWMVVERKGTATETDMIQNGPKPRSASRRDTAISTLHACGLVYLSNEKPAKWKVLQQW